MKKGLLLTLLVLVLPGTAFANYYGSGFNDARVNDCFELDVGVDLGNGSVVYVNGLGTYYLVQSGADGNVRTSDLSTFTDPYFGPPPNVEYYSLTGFTGTYFDNGGGLPVGSVVNSGCTPTSPPVAGGTWSWPPFATILGSTTEAANLAIRDFLTPFYIIFAILAGGLFAVMIRKWLWRSGRRVWER